MRGSTGPSAVFSLFLADLAVGLRFAVDTGRSQQSADCFGMPTTDRASAPFYPPSARRLTSRLVHAPRLIMAGTIVVLTIASLAISPGSLLAQTPVTLFGTGTPGVLDAGVNQSVVVGVKIFSDVPGQVLGCSFYKAPTNVGTHVVSLWDSTGKLLATQMATGETASGKQSVQFSIPVAIAAKQTFTCGYLAPAGHFSYDKSTFAVQKDSAPLHVPIEGGVYVYATQANTFPTSNNAAGANYWVDVLFAPSTGAVSGTWISQASVSTTGNAASVTWSTAVPSDSQVEYGPTTSYGSTTAVAPARVAAHAVAIGDLQSGTTYHFRVRSRDSDSVSAIGLDNTLSTGASALPVSIFASPLNPTVASGGAQQFTATVANTSNQGVTWSATAGVISMSGLFTAPQVSSPTTVVVTATSQADSTKRVSATVSVNPASAGLSISPASLSFAGQTGTASPAPTSVSVTNSGGGTLAFTGTSDQPWLTLSAASGTAPATLQISPNITGLKAGTYTGHVNLAGGGSTRTVTVALTLTSPPIQHSVALSWKASTDTHVISYSMYRSTIAGSSYGLAASAIGGASYHDQSVASGTTYYYVVAAVDDQGRESPYSSEVRVAIP